MGKYDHDGFRAALTGPVNSHVVFFSRDGNIDYKAMRRMIDFTLQAGSRTIMLTYGNSLYSTLSDLEVAEVTKAVVKFVKGRAMVIAADRQWATAQAVEFAKFARGAGADMVMARPPNWAGAVTTETLVAHYSALAGEMPLMIVTAAFTGIQSAGLKVLEILRDKLPFFAVKDDLCGVFGRKLGLLLHKKCPIVSGGQKQNHLDIHPYGCDGYLSTFLDFKPEIAQTYWRTIQANKIPEAVEIIAKYDLPFWDFAGKFPGQFDAVIHGAVELFGLAKRWRRKPYYSLNDREMAKLKDYFVGQGLL
ncbi:dihydrodipicolinate synthase family protein [Verrucomicrobiota bacterium]